MSCPSWKGGNRQLCILDFVVYFEEQTFNKRAQFLWPMKIIKKSRAGIDREQVNSLKTWKGSKKMTI